MFIMLKRDENNSIIVYRADDNLNEIRRMRYGNTLLIYKDLRIALIVLEERYAAYGPVFIDENGNIITNGDHFNN